MMRVGLITAFPPSKVTLNEYGYYLAKYYLKNSQVSELILFSDITEDKKLTDFDHLEKLTIEECWEFNSYKSVFSIVKAVKKHKPDIIVINAHFLKFADKKIPAALGLMMSFFLKFTGTPSIFLIHNILEKVDLAKAGFTSNPILKAIYNAIGYLLTRFILMADIVAVTIDKYVDILEDKYHVKHVALKPHGAFDIPPPPDFILPSGPKKVMAFGKFGTYKKVDYMIDAVKLIRKRNPTLDIEIVIAGMDSPNAIGYLENTAKKYQDVPQLHFLGYIHENDVERVFKESAVVVFPYTSTTGSSGVLHQAGGFGNAVVLPNIDDLAHLIEEEGYVGEYFEPDSAESLSQAIEKLLTQDALRKEMGTRNYKVATSLPMDDIIRWYMAHSHLILDTLPEYSELSSDRVFLIPEKLTVDNYESFLKTIESENKSYTLDGKLLQEIDLAGFNCLVHLAMIAIEQNFRIAFKNVQNDDLERFIHLSKLKFLF